MSLHFLFHRVSSFSLSSCLFIFSFITLSLSSSSCLLSCLTSFFSLLVFSPLFSRSSLVLSCLVSSLFSLVLSFIFSCLVLSFIFSFLLFSCLVSPVSSSLVFLSCLVLSLLFHLLLYSCLVSSSPVLSSLVFFCLLFSCLSSAVFSSLSLCLCLPLSLSLSVSLCLLVVLWSCRCVVSCVLVCVLWCVCVCRCGRGVRACGVVCPFKTPCVDSKHARVHIQNVPVRTCVSTCARFTGTHGHVLNGHMVCMGEVRVSSSASCFSSVESELLTFLEHLNRILRSSLIANFSAYHEWPT